MSPNEEYVIGLLAAKFRGTFQNGENPPDGYICTGGKKIAVEVSRLVERVTGEDGVHHSRFKHDRPAEQLANEIEVCIGDSIPDGLFVFLILSAPIRNIRKTKRFILQAIVEIIETNEDSVDLTISGNAISISIYRDWPGKGSKIGSAIRNRYSSANISKNAAALLRERIETKTLKRAVVSDTTEYWLALYNDYWVADADTYRAAFRIMQIAHGFDQIFIVDSYGRSHSLW